MPSMMMMMIMIMMMMTMVMTMMMMTMMMMVVMVVMPRNDRVFVALSEKNKSEEWYLVTHPQ